MYLSHTKNVDFVNNGTVVIIGGVGVGKSTVFSELVGKKYSHCYSLQQSSFCYKFNCYNLVKLPSVYSLYNSSPNSKLANCFLQNNIKNIACVICVVDASNISVSLQLIYQLLSITSRVVVLLNFWDKTCKINKSLNLQILSNSIGDYIVKSTAYSGKGINTLLEQIHIVSQLK